MGLPHLTFWAATPLHAHPFSQVSWSAASWMCQRQSVSSEGIVHLLWQLLNYGMTCLCPLGRSLHCLYLNQLLKHIFFLWPLTSDADIQHWQFYCFLMCFYFILCLVWVLFLCTALWSTSVFFKCFINKVWLIDWLIDWLMEKKIFTKNIMLLCMYCCHCITGHLCFTSMIIQL